jgi:uncharacterized membrane protein YcaP (DUF421 family)
MRIMGKRQIGEMQASELVVTLMISNIATIPMQEIDIPLMSGILPIFTMVALEIFLSLLMLKCAKVRHLISGNPILIVSHGKIIQDAMKKIRFSNEDLFEELRKASIFDLSTVEYAIVEPDGVLSIKQYSAELPPSASTMNIDAGESSFATLLVSDGVIQQGSMNFANWNEDRILKTVKKEKVALKDIYIMVGNINGQYSIVKKDDDK